VCFIRKKKKRSTTIVGRESEGERGGGHTSYRILQKGGKVLVEDEKGKRKYVLSLIRSVEGGSFPQKERAATAATKGKDKGPPEATQC